VVADRDQEEHRIGDETPRENRQPFHGLKIRKTHWEGRPNRPSSGPGRPSIVGERIDGRLDEAASVKVSYWLAR
jgi:hypothetical protein